MNKEESYKYPNVELKRVFEAKKFRTSNTLISRMLSTRATAATVAGAKSSVSPNKRGSYATSLNPVAESTVNYASETKRVGGSSVFPSRTSSSTYSKK